MAGPMAGPKKLSAEELRELYRHVEWQYVRVHIRSHIAALEAELAQCFRLSGADPDGDEDWRLAPRAVSEVTRLRGEFDELQANYPSKLAELAEAKRDGERLRRSVLKEAADYVRSRSMDEKWHPSSDGELEHFADHTADDLENDWMAEVSAARAAIDVEDKSDV